MAVSISAEQKEVLDKLSKWWITVAVTGSLLIQLLLLLTGGTRKWSMATRFVAWNAYNWADFIATSALGGLAQRAAGSNANETGVYAIWAPMLLLHLGAPDNISAYAMADAELWQRHGLTMLLQTATVLYVVANCARGWKYVLLSICLTVLGSFKYGERTLALKHASRADVVESVFPIYHYMRAEVGLTDLGIRGLNICPVSTSESHLPASRTSHPSPCYYYIVRGEKQWLRKYLQAGDNNNLNSFRNAVRDTPRLITMQDVLSSQQLKEAPSMVWLCAGFALFKLYKRRLSALYMYEWRAEKTRALFVDRHVFEDVKEIIFVLDVELRFLFDSLYTKAAGTAFTKVGVSFRVLTTILLVVSGIFILGDLNFQDQAIEQGRNVTFCLIAAALVIEAYQLGRLVLSDWTRVWLVCTYIVVGEELKSKLSSSIVSHCMRRFGLATLLRMIKLLSFVGMRHEYWRSRIGQYSMVDVDNPSVWHCTNKKLARLMTRGHRLQLLPEYMHGRKEAEEFKIYIFTKALEACHRIRATNQTLSPDWFLPQYKDQREQLRILLAAFGFSHQAGNNEVYIDLEHLVVNWHVATCVCELLAAPPAMQQIAVHAGAHDNQHADSRHTSDIERSGAQIAGTSASSPALHEPAAAADGVSEETTMTLTDNAEFRLSKLLSRYVMYLLVHKTELLPCHADIARQTVIETQRGMCKVSWNTQAIIDLLNMQQTTSNSDSIPSSLRSGMEAARLLQGLGSEEERWRLVAEVWVAILVCCASANKSIEQLHQLTLGGEFLTHLWVLLGHMGYGSQN